MHAALSRRSFLAAAALTGGALWAPAAQGIEPIERVGRPRLRSSLAAYSLRPLFVKPADDPAKITMVDFVRYAATLEVDAVEPTGYFFAEPVAREELTQVKRAAHLLGLDISGGAIANNFTLPAGDALEQQFAHVERWLDYYALLGAPVIRVFAGKPPQGVSEAEAIKNAIANFERAGEMAAQRGIFLGLENHDFTMQPDRLLQIVRGVKSPWFGVNLDSGNFIADDPYAAMEQLAPYAVNVQLKVEFKHGGQTTPTDVPRVVQIVHDAGYRGYIALEYEAGGDLYAEIPKHLAVLNEAIAAVR